MPTSYLEIVSDLEATPGMADVILAGTNQEEGREEGREGGREGGRGGREESTCIYNV